MVDIVGAFVLGSSCFVVVMYFSAVLLMLSSSMFLVLVWVLFWFWFLFDFAMVLYLGCCRFSFSSFRSMVGFVS